MSKFILVHEAPTGNPIVLNSDTIVIIEKSKKYNGGSVINDGDFITNTVINAVETPEQIFEMLK